MEEKYKINRNNSEYKDEDLLYWASLEVTKTEKETKEVCNLLNRKVTLNTKDKIDYYIAVYTLNNLETKNSFCINDYFLNEKEGIEFNRFGVVREGQYIDLLDGANIRLFDVDNNTENGVINNHSKVNVKTSLANIGDVGIIEYRREEKYKEFDSVRQDFARHVAALPEGSYFHYIKYSLIVVNNTDNPMKYQRRNFDSSSYLINEFEKGVVMPGEELVFARDNWSGFTERSGFPPAMLELATETTWEYLAKYLDTQYKECDEGLKDEEVKVFLDNLLQDEGIETKIQKLIQYVQDKVQYVFDADEMWGYIPQAANITLKVKTGDCKAKSLLLQKLLSYIGVKSNLILVNYDNLYLDNDLPSPFTFNHMILEVCYGDIVKFVDPTLYNCKGKLEYRGEPIFLFFLRISQDGHLAKRDEFKYKWPIIESILNIESSGDWLNIREISHVRGTVADSARRAVAVQSQENLRNQVMESIILNLDNSTLLPQDIEKIIENSSFRIVSDNLEENILTYEVLTVVPIILNIDGNRIIKYYDKMFINQLVNQNPRKDKPYVIADVSKKQTIYLKSERYFDKKKVFSDLKINNEYFDYEISKEFGWKKVTVSILYEPHVLSEVPQAEIENLRKDYNRIADSRYGIGVLNPVNNWLKRVFLM